MHVSMLPLLHSIAPRGLLLELPTGQPVTSRSIILYKDMLWSLLMNSKPSIYYGHDVLTIGLAIDLTLILFPENRWTFTLSSRKTTPKHPALFPLLYLYNIVIFVVFALTARNICFPVAASGCPRFVRPEDCVPVFARFVAVFESKSKSLGFVYIAEYRFSSRNISAEPGVSKSISDGIKTAFKSHSSWNKTPRHPPCFFG